MKSNELKKIIQILFIENFVTLRKSIRNMKNGAQYPIEAAKRWTNITSPHLMLSQYIHQMHQNTYEKILVQSNFGLLL